MYRAGRLAARFSIHSFEPMPVNARRLIRKMRGGAQAHLLECDDGCFYITKFVNNPQHRRILVNEWISSVFLKFLEISAPDVAVVNLSQAFLEENTDVYLQLGSRRQTVEPGWHFGSCHPGDPSKMTVYDFVPDTLLEKVVNLAEFLGALDPGIVGLPPRSQFVVGVRRQ